MKWALLAVLACTGTTETDETEDTEDTDTSEVPGSRVQLSVGQDFPCAVTADGEAACWGSVLLGDGPLFLEGSYRLVAGGVFEILAIRANGTLDCVPLDGQMCGYEPEGDDFVSASIHGHEACVVREGGTAYCWGDGGGAHSTPEGPWTEVSVGHMVTCFLGEDRVVCRPPGGEPEGLEQVSAGAVHACGIDGEGALVCWGPESHHLEPSPETLDVPDGRFLHVSAGTESPCAVGADGSVQCWGPERARPPEAPPGPFTQVASGWGFACGIQADGTVACWGEAEQGAGDLTPPW